MHATSHFKYTHKNLLMNVHVAQKTIGHKGSLHVTTRWNNTFEAHQIFMGKFFLLTILGNIFVNESSVCVSLSSAYVLLPQVLLPLPPFQYRISNTLVGQHALSELKVFLSSKTPIRCVIRWRNSITQTKLQFEQLWYMHGLDRCFVYFWQICE